MSDKPVTLVIIDDDQRIAELHRRFVEKLSGFEVLGVADNLADAYDMIEVLQPDLVLLDLFFPEGNGLDLLKRLRSGEHACDVILITAAREMASVQEAVRGGAFDYIIKPVYFPRFREALENYQAFHLRSQDGGRLEQQEVDRLLHAQRLPEAETERMPKGIDALTLTKVRNVFSAERRGDMNAEEVGREVGISRSTARRYLEFLVSEGFLKADLIYGVVGRPERRYLRAD